MKLAQPAIWRFRLSRCALLAGALAAVTLLATPGAAKAEEFVRAGPVNQFTTTSVSMDQGERLTFQNNDYNAHNVTSKQASDLPGSVNGSLFASDTIGGPGGSAFVAGSQYLTTGSYAFYCSIHPQMEGTLNVSSAGTPVPRPGDGGGGGGGGGGLPTVDLAIRGSNLNKLADRRRLKLRITSDEAVSANIKAKVKGVGTIARKSGVEIDPGGETVKLKVRRSAARELDDRNRAKVRVRASFEDAQGNSVTERTNKRFD